MKPFLKIALFIVALGFATACEKHQAPEVTPPTTATDATLGNNSPGATGTSPTPTVTGAAETTGTTTGTTGTDTTMSADKAGSAGAPGAAAGEGAMTGPAHGGKPAASDSTTGNAGTTAKSGTMSDTTGGTAPAQQTNQRIAPEESARQACLQKNSALSGKALDVCVQKRMKSGHND